MPARRKPARPAKKNRAPGKDGSARRKPVTSARREKSVRAQALEPSRGIASTRETVSGLNDDEARALALACRDAASSKKADDVLMLDIREKAGFADYFVLGTGRSVIQARAIADAVVEASEDRFGAPLRTEGYNDGSWILVDYGPVIVHVFTPQAREFYNLERLWGKQPSSAKRKS